MEMSLYLLANIILFIVCLAMGTVFFSLPNPNYEGLKTYKISLKILGSSYLTLALLTFATIYFKLPDNGRELFTFTNISISSFQAFLFSNALITLLNPKIATKKYLTIQISPFIALLIAFIISNLFYNNPVLKNINELGMYLSNPTLWIRLLFYIYFLFQIVFYTTLFFREEKKYKQLAINYFSDDVWLKISWVRFAFIASLLVGIISLCAYLVPVKWDWLFNLIYSLFYLVFGLEYIKYHKIYPSLKPNIISLSKTEILNDNNKRSKWTWSDLKSQIIENEYFLEPGITIEELAKRLSIGRTTLSNFINREECINYNKWINMLRIERSKELLLVKPEIPMSEISEKVGYSEQANFSRQFRQIVGFAPTVWRQKKQSIALD